MPTQLKIINGQKHLRPPQTLSRFPKNFDDFPSRSLGDKLQSLAVLDPYALGVIDELVDQLLADATAGETDTTRYGDLRG